MVTAQDTEKTTTLTLTLPAELYDQMRSKAEYLGIEVDKLAAVLLNYGLSVQNDKEQAISRLAEQVAVSSSEEDAAGATDQLGKIIFPE